MNVAYRETLVWMDTDCFSTQEDRARLLKQAGKRIRVLLSERCFEGFLLSLLEPLRDWKSCGSDEAKKRFHGHYLSENRVTDPARYADIFKGGLDALESLRKLDSDAGRLLDVLMHALFGREERG